MDCISSSQSVTKPGEARPSLESANLAALPLPLWDVSDPAQASEVLLDPEQRAAYETGCDEIIAAAREYMAHVDPASQGEPAPGAGRWAGPRRLLRAAWGGPRERAQECACKKNH